MHRTDEKKPTGSTNSTAGSTDHAILPNTASAIKMTGSKFIASAARIVNMVALFCAVVVAPAACSELIGAPATNCAAGCEDV